MAGPSALVFVTGVSSGIGKAIAETVPLPARVIGISRRALPGVQHVPADLSDPSGWERVAHAFEQEVAGFEGDRIVFLHAAGTLTPIGFAGEVDRKGYERQVLLNAACPLVLGDAFLRATRDVKAACELVMISSGAAHSVYEGWSAYGSGKAAVDQWVRTVGAELARRKRRCRVVSIAPGVIATPMQEEIRATPITHFPARDRFVALHARGELRDPTEAARDIWTRLREGFENGAVLDLRQ